MALTFLGATNHSTAAAAQMIKNSDIKATEKEPVASRTSPEANGPKDPPPTKAIVMIPLIAPKCFPENRSAVAGANIAPAAPLEIPKSTA